MKRAIALFIAALLVLMGAAALGESYRIARENENHFAALLWALVNAYETPTAGDDDVIEGTLDAIEAVDADDYEVAKAIADQWRRVYLSDYPLRVYGGGADAPELAGSGIPEGPGHAFVVLGYELKKGRMTDELKGRCDAAAAAARAYPDAILVCSGGATGDNNPKRHTEAGLMRDYFVEHCGIDPARVRVDERARTTLENAQNTYAILEANGIRTMTIVTSTYHQRWGQAVYNAVGALIRQATGYDVEIISNYCFDIEPSRDAYRADDRIAARQIANALGLPEEISG